MQECIQISRSIRRIIKFQQQEEEDERKKYKLDERQLSFLQQNRNVLSVITAKQPELCKYLMRLQKTEVNVHILEESKIAKTLKYLSDYCQLY